MSRCDAPAGAGGQWPLLLAGLWIAGIGLVLIPGCNKGSKPTTPAARRDGARTEPRRDGPERRAAARGEPGRETGTGPAARDGGEDRPRAEDPPRAADPPPVTDRLPTVTELRDWLSAGAYDRVLRGAKQIIEKDEKNVPAMAAMAMAYFRKNEIELCRAVLDVINTHEKENEHWIYLWGHLYIKEGNHRLAQIYFEKAVAKNPQLLDAWLVLGFRYLQSGSYEKAKNALEKAKALPGGNTYRVALNLGSSCRGLAHQQGAAGQALFQSALGHYDEAERLYRQATGGSKPYLAVIYNRAVLYLDAPELPGLTKVKRIEQGIAHLEQYVAQAKRHAAGEWNKEKTEVLALLSKAKTVDLPAAKAAEQAPPPRDAGARPAPARDGAPPARDATPPARDATPPARDATPREPARDAPPPR
jgi:tetratricopeptide (TPR) repeat protein